MGNRNDINNNTTLLNLLSDTFDRVKQLADANSIIGEKIEVNNMTIIPVSKVSVGFAGGGAELTDNSKKRKRIPAGSGAGVNLTPVSFLVISENDVQLVTIPTAEEKKSKVSDLIESVMKQVKKPSKPKKDK